MIASMRYAIAGHVTAKRGQENNKHKKKYPREPNKNGFVAF